jgi:hypothetical protein
MKRLWLIFSLILSALFIPFASCDDDEVDEIPDIEKYPSLKVSNQAEDEIRPFNIYAVDLPGYDFEALTIPIGDSQTFILDEGMPEGYEEIDVIIRFGTIGFDHSQSVAVNFENGKTSKITLKGCMEWVEECDGHYIE